MTRQPGRRVEPWVPTNRRPLDRPRGVDPSKLVVIGEVPPLPPRPLPPPELPPLTITDLRERGIPILPVSYGRLYLRVVSRRGWRTRTHPRLRSASRLLTTLLLFVFTAATLAVILMH